VSSMGREKSARDVALPNLVGFTWTNPRGGKRPAAIAGAMADADGARATRTATRRQLAFDVQSAFIATLRDAAALDFAKQDRAGIEEARQLEEIRYQDGKIAYNDVLKLRLQVGAADDTVAQAELTLEGDRAELARLVGADRLAPDFTLVGQLATPTDVPDLTAEQLLEHALSRRGDYHAMLAGERSASSSLTAARRTPIPDIAVLLDYDQVPDSAGQFDLQLSVSIPLFDRNHGAIRQASASARKAHLASESLRAQIAADAQTAVSAWKASRARLDVYDQEMSADAKESLEISRHAYEQGRGSLLDYLDAEASYRAVETAYLAAVGDAMVAAARLSFVVGEDAP
jgi:cobalt-zinc-cadmium efflux system outer membrane protein